MTLSREQLILAEIKTRLEGAPQGPITKPTGLVVERSRLRELQPSQLPAVSIYPLEADPEDVGFLTQEDLAVKIAIYAKAPEGTPIDQVLDEIQQWIHQQLTADRSLGALCMSTRIFKKVWGFSLAQNPFGDLDLHILITFRHQAADLTRP